MCTDGAVRGTDQFHYNAMTAKDVMQVVDLPE
jgi:hypothetical protein